VSPRAHLKCRIEGPARSNNAQLFVEYNYGFPDRIDDALSQCAGVCDICKLFSEICFLHRVLAKSSKVFKKDAGRCPCFDVQ
jgi:hypothetical protein